jgi:hypothetical protein
MFFNYQTLENYTTKEHFTESTESTESSEDQCYYVSSRGLLKSCDKYVYNPRSSNNELPSIENLEKGQSIYICTTALPNFAEHYLHRISTPFVLVSGDADETIGSDSKVPRATTEGPISHSTIEKILSYPFLITWFAQNCLMSHIKLIHLPIGLDYHSTLGGNFHPLLQEKNHMTLIQDSKHFTVREIKIYSTFHFALHRGDRKEAYDSIPKDLIDYEHNQVSREESFTKQLKYAFVASPYGNGPDCHRTWEALLLGCIPIVKSSKMDPVFEDLPILLVKKWHDVTYELLKNTIEDFKTKQFKMEKITLSYWVNRFKH